MRKSRAPSITTMPRSRYSLCRELLSRHHSQTSLVKQSDHDDCTQLPLSDICVTIYSSQEQILHSQGSRNSCLSKTLPPRLSKYLACGLWHFGLPQASTISIAYITTGAGARRTGKNIFVPRPFSIKSRFLLVLFLSNNSIAYLHLQKVAPIRHIFGLPPPKCRPL
ncbi:hypothetical protein BDU57DRAFT_518169 [Ampelomyces quisqualis]|uniref:Uncharacterized protein n=1 Tax=Ampelomyces quisqualis TaxID=50730 RepID=A0A6A5QLD5_AMPQU|nr:hypothetical protein BDU57DRAFT_518169 [Ampelomyces quisqualis]